MTTVKSKDTKTSEKITLKEKLKTAGPGAIVAAGIIGPGSITTLTLVGAEWRYAPLWILVLAALVTYIFQAPAIRLAAASRITIMQATRSHVSKTAAIIMFIAAFIGALAFQAGNFIGAGMAMNYLLPGITIPMWATITALITLIIVWVGIYKVLENIMTAIILLMVAAFVITAFGSRPAVGEVLGEGFQFSTLGGDWMLIGALIATTVPPTAALAYSSFIQRKLPQQGRNPSRIIQMGSFDLRTNTVLIGVISIAVVITSATVIYGTNVTIESAADMAAQLTPMLGRYAGVLFALGLFAAGISSGLYHASLQPTLLSESMGKDPNPRTPISRTVVGVVLILPVIFVWVFGQAPVQLIVTAQALNALVLPAVVIIMLILVRKVDLLGTYKYTGWRLFSLAGVAAITLALGVRVLITLLS